MLNSALGYVIDLIAQIHQKVVEIHRLSISKFMCMNISKLSSAVLLETCTPHYILMQKLLSKRIRSSENKLICLRLSVGCLIRLKRRKKGEKRLAVK